MAVSETDRLTAFVNRYPTCPVCGGKDWQSAQADGRPMITKILSGPMLGPVLDTYSIICNTCGTLRLISQGSVP
jgi:hypothetical protein